MVRAPRTTSTYANPAALATSEVRNSDRMSQAYEAHEPTQSTSLTEGERWTVDQLVALHDGDYRPLAWAELIRASLQRSAKVRRARPELVRQARRWEIAGALAWLGASRALRSEDRAAPRVRRGLIWWAGVGKMLDWHLGMAEDDDGMQREGLSRADAVTLTRLWLVPLLGEVQGSPPRLSALIVLGGITDWLDGALAGSESTRLGRDLDTAADLCFFGAATRAVYCAGRLPGFAAAALGTRYLTGLSLGVALTFRYARRPVIASRRWGAPLRAGGLALAAAGARRTGGVLSTLGCTALRARPSGRW